MHTESSMLNQLDSARGAREREKEGEKERARETASVSSLSLSPSQMGEVSPLYHPVTQHLSSLPDLCTSSPPPPFFPEQSNRQIRLNELLKEHSSTANLIVM